MIYTTTHGATEEPNPHHFLKKEIETIFGQRIITSRECLMLADEIYNKTSSLINFNTIRRFFGLVKARYPASNATIKILSAYCGFNSIDDLIEARKEHTQAGKSLNGQNLLNYLVMIFKSTRIKENNDETFNSFVKITIEHLNGNDGLMKLLQKEIVKTGNGRRFYFEQNINYDKLNSFYGDGLVDYMEDASDDEENVFALSLLCLRDWLANNKASLKRNFTKMKTSRLTNCTPLFVWGQYLSATLLFAESCNENTEKLLHEAFLFHENTKAKHSTPKVFQSFEFIYANALVLTGHYSDALYYINYTLGNYAHIYAPEHNCCLRKMLLLKAVALSKLNKLQEARKIYELINPSNFSFLSTKFDTALYLMLTINMKKEGNKTDEQLERLIEQTGFVKLRSVCFD